MTEKFYSGFVAIIGQPNVGKSTLLNCFVGEKISIVSHKAQTTRNKILSVVTKDDYQIVFLDTPGIHKPKNRLGEYMKKCVNSAISDVDLLLFLVEPRAEISQAEKDIIAGLPKNVPVFLVINKIDIIEKGSLLKIIDGYKGLYNFKEIIPISALKADKTDELLASIRNYLGEGPKYFPDDVITDQPERQIIAEFIREKALFFLQEEIPHGIAVEIISMKKRQGKASELMDIEATIYCEKDSHKGMVIGKNGDMLKKIGTRARDDIERLLGEKVFLQLWVKIKKDWRDNDIMLKNFGYKELS